MASFAVQQIPTCLWLHNIILKTLYGYTFHMTWTEVVENIIQKICV